VKILPDVFGLWTRNFPLNFGSPLDPDLRII